MPVGFGSRPVWLSRGLPSVAQGLCGRGSSESVGQRSAASAAGLGFAFLQHLTAFTALFPDTGVRCPADSAHLSHAAVFLEYS